MKTALVSIAAVLLFALTTQAQSGVNFSNALVNGSGGYEPVSVTIADVNADGKADLLITNLCASASHCVNVSPQTCADCDGSVGVLLGNGDGTFQSAVTYSSGGDDASGVVVADVNGDGKLDLLVANQCVPPSPPSTVPCSGSNPLVGSVGVLLGNGDGTFQPAVAYPTAGIAGRALTVADVNGDGKPDLLVTIQCSNNPCSGDSQVGVLLGNGDGTFRAAVTYSSGGYADESIAVQDVNGDGKPDIVVANQCASYGNCTNGGGVGVLLGNGDGTFQSAVSYSSAGIADSVTIADVNGDGKPDLLVANYCIPGNCPSATTGTVVVLLGNGNGTFRTAVAYDSGGYAQPSVVVADVNDDGKPDLLVASQCTDSACTSNGTVGVLVGNGDGTFQPVTNYGSGGFYAASLEAADVNGDTKPDLVVVNQQVSSSDPSNGVVGVLLNTSGVNGPLLVFSPKQLTLAPTAVGSTSPPQGVTLTNVGVAPLVIDDIRITGGGSASFNENNTCGSSLAPNGTCSISVTFAPINNGPSTATLIMTDGAPGSPQTVTLSGTGQAGPPGPPPNGPGASVLPAAITFPGQYVGTSGLPQTVTVTNTGNANLSVTSVAANPSDFGVLNNCTNPVAPGSNCTIGVFFDPTAGGTRTGSLTITDNATGSPQAVTLTGTGQDFSMAPGSATSATISAGQSATYSLAVVSTGGFAQSVSLSCSGGPAMSTCLVSPNAIALSGTAAKTVTVTVATAAQGWLLPFRGSWRVNTDPRMCLVPMQAAILFAGIVALIWWRKPRWRQVPALTFMSLVCVGMALTSCGGGSSDGGGDTTNPQAGTYAITVTGYFSSGSANLTHTTKLTLIVH